MPSGVRRLRLQHCAPCFSHKSRARRGDERVGPPELPQPPAPGGRLALTRPAAALIATGSAFFRLAQSVNETAAPR